MRTFTDAEIISRVETHAKGFVGWRPGVYDVWVRSKADAYDQFDDKVFTYHVGSDGKPQFVPGLVCTGTTNAGSFGLKNFRRWNPDGCAVLESDRIVYDSHVYGLHKGKPAYRQNRDFPFYRDGDSDRRAEEIGPLRHGVIGANCHRAGVFSKVIFNWSVACLVRNQLSQFLKWLDYLKSVGYPPLTVCILKEF